MNRSSGRRGRKGDSISPEEQSARYGFLLDELPRSVIRSAHAEAFAALSPAQRRELLALVSASLAEDARDAACDEPDVLAALVEGTDMTTSMLAGVIASAFIVSGPVQAYYTTGAGSVVIDEQPPWVTELVHHQSALIDAGKGRHGWQSPVRAFPMG